jgi:hypothetical protein
MDPIWYIVIGSVVAILLPFVWKFLDKQLAVMKDSRLHRAMLELDGIVEVLIETALDTKVAEARKKSRGRLTKAAGAAIKQEVIEEAIATVKPSTRKLLTKEYEVKNFGLSLDGQVGHRVEFLLEKVKEKRGIKKTRKTRKKKG